MAPIKKRASTVLAEAQQELVETDTGRRRTTKPHDDSRRRIHPSRRERS
jgi:hypothetical protein